MSDNQDGRVPLAPGSLFTHDAPTDRRPSGFDPSRMDPRALGMACVGEAVIFLAANGYAFELNEAKLCFEPGQELTVTDVVIGGWSSSYRFAGCGNALWNTVMFAPRDSDGSGEAGETVGLDPKGDSAGRNGIAHT